MFGSGIQLTLLIGTSVPASAPTALMEALESVEITSSDNGPAGFQMHFHADREEGLPDDFQMFSSPLLAAGSRVVISVTMQGAPTVLMDGLINTHGSGASTITVTGEDISVAMDLVEVSMDYPMMEPMEIVQLVLLRYAAFGVVPEIIPPLNGGGALPLDAVPQQNTTDRGYVRQLAASMGNHFFIRPGPVPLMNQAYWGPPICTGVPQKTLTVDMGPNTNVESIQFQYQPLSTDPVYDTVQDTQILMDQPVLTPGSTRMPPPARPAAREQNSLFQDPRLGTIDTVAKAQSQTNGSPDRVVTVQGEVDVLRYGSILQAARLVAVRGAGPSYDGLYMVQSVTHKLNRGSYHQSFTLNREGLESTIFTAPP